MAPPTPADYKDDFEPRSHPIDDEIGYQRKVWRFERVGWWLLALATLLTLLGLFSEGPLSTREVRQGSLGVQYDFFERNGAIGRLVITAAAPAPGEPVQIELNGHLLDAYTIEIIQPHPLESASGPAGGIRIAMQPDSTGIATAYLSIRPDSVGLVRGAIASGTERIAITQFIYP
jgi:hypothetical protein